MAAIDDPMVQATLARTRRSLRLKWLPPILLFVAGVILFSWENHLDAQFEKHAKTTPADVVAIDRRSAESERVSKIKFAFTPEGRGDLVSVTRYSDGMHKVGDSVTVRYDTHHPESAYLGSDGGPDNNTTAYVFWFLIAIVCIVFEIAVLGRSRRLRAIQRILERSEWRPVQIESWSVGLLHHDVVIVKFEDESKTHAFEVDRSIGQGVLLQMETSSSYEGALDDKGSMVVRSVGASRLTKYDPIGRSRPMIRRYLRRLESVSPLMKAQD